MRAHHPPAPSPLTPHPTPTWPLPTPGLHFLGVLRVFKGCPHPPAPSPPTPHPTPAWPLPTPGLHFLGVLRVFKGCQCVPTPPGALTAHTLPHPCLATTHTWLAFPRCFESIYRLPMRAHTPPRPHRPHPTPPLPGHYPHLACIS